MKITVDYYVEGVCDRCGKLGEGITLNIYHYDSCIALDLTITICESCISEIFKGFSKDK